VFDDGTGGASIAPVLFLIFAPLLGTIPAAIAHNKGSSFIGWWLYGSALFIIAFPHALLMKAPTPVEAEWQAVLFQVEQKSGQNQKELSIRSGLPTYRVVQALIELEAREMVRVEETGRKIQTGNSAKTLTPEVAVFPALRPRTPPPLTPPPGRSSAGALPQDPS
jgi:hypothetical protein